MYTGPYVTRGSKAAFLQEQDTVLFHRASTNGTHCLVCALFSSGVGLPAVYTLSVTLWRNFPYVRCVISVRRQKKKRKKKIERERQNGMAPSLRVSSCSFSQPARSIGCHTCKQWGRHCAVADKGPSQTVWEFKWSGPTGSTPRRRACEWRERERRRGR